MEEREKEEPGRNIGNGRKEWSQINPILFPLGLPSLHRRYLVMWVPNTSMLCRFCERASCLTFAQLATFEFPL